MRPFLRWWVIFCLSALAIVILHFGGFTETLVNGDPSRISFGILALFAATSVWIGLLTRQVTRGQNTSLWKLKPIWWAAEFMVGLGLIGTLLGFSWVLGSAFGALDPTQAEEIRSAMQHVGIGISTAILTTLVGISSSHITKLQLVNLEYLIDGKVQE